MMKTGIMTLALTCILASGVKAQNIYVSTFSPANVSLITELTVPFGVTAFEDNLSVADWGGTVGKYGLDGSTINASPISVLDDPTHIAISPAPEPSALTIVGLGVAAIWLWRLARM